MNKKIALFLLIVGFLLTGASVAHAGVTTTFTPTPYSDLYSLDHYYYYTWGIGWTPPAGQVITGAEIDITNIDNYTNIPNDPNILYIHLLDSAPLVGSVPGTNTTVTWDNAEGGDAFAGQGVHLTDFTDPTPYGDPKNWSYNFTPSQLTALQNFASNDGRFGLGFDPDCHFYNDGVTLKITTCPGIPSVPEPASLLLFGIGGAARAFINKKKRTC